MTRYIAAAIVAVTLLAGVSSAAMPDSQSAATPAWETNYGTALKATRADDRPLLVVLETPSEAASEVKQVTFSQEAVSEKEAALLAPYQLCRVDASTSYGKKVAEAFGATSFPHTTIIDKTGSVVIFAKTGELTSMEWFQALEDYKNGERTDAFLAASSSETSQVLFQKPHTASYGSTCTSCQKNGTCASGNCSKSQYSN